MRPKTRFVARFLGKSNLLPATVGSPSDRGLRVTLGGVEIVHTENEQLVQGMEILLALRPERIRIGTPNALETGLGARVEDIVIAGPVTDIALSTPDGSRLNVHCVTGSDAVPAIGEHVPLAWPTTATVRVVDC
jgi:ABC-type Fe3+/spermidine/putrescine transport system ATPase subunit